MRKLEWNALHVGDHVLVHDQTDAGLALLPGIVAIIDTGTGSNDIGVKIEHPRRILRPSRLAVHLDPMDGTEDCWRCDDGVEPAAERARVSEVGARR
jgi:hypothetical protein